MKHMYVLINRANSNDRPNIYRNGALSFAIEKESNYTKQSTLPEETHISASNSLPLGNRISSFPSFKSIIQSLPYNQPSPPITPLLPPNKPSPPITPLLPHNQPSPPITPLLPPNKPSSPTIKLLIPNKLPITSIYVQSPPSNKSILSSTCTSEKNLACIHEVNFRYRQRYVVHTTDTL